MKCRLQLLKSLGAVVSGRHFLYTMSSSTPLPPGPRAWPLVGNLPLMAKHGAEQANKFFNEVSTYGPVSTFYFGRFPVILLGSYDAVHEAFVQNSAYFQGRPVGLTGVEAVCERGKGIAYESGDRWWEMRRTTLSALSGPGVGQLVLEDVILGEVERLLGELAQRKGTPFHPEPLFFNYCLNVQCGIILGQRYSRDDPKFQEIWKTLSDVYNTDSPFSTFSALPWLKHVPIVNRGFHKFKKTYETFYAVLQSHLDARASLHRHDDTVRCMMDLYLQERKAKPEIYKDGSIIRAETDLFFGGTNSVAKTLSWILLYLLGHPDTQARCRREINKVCGESEAVTVDDMDKLPHTRATIQEGQRLGNAIPTTVPRSTERDITVQGFHIPAGTMIMANTTAVHMDRKQWAEPETFNPDRFLDDDGELVTRAAFMPLSKGARNCAGEDLTNKILFLLVANLLRQFTLTKTSDVPLTYDGVMHSGLGPRPYDVIVTPNDH